MNIPNAVISDDFNIDELTQGKLDGQGVFDKLMQTLELHLEREYHKQRIRGTDYANAYIGLINNALNQVSSYALAKSKLPLELQMLEAQIHKVATDTIVATKQGGLIDAQIYKEMAQTEMLHLEMEYKLPKELLMIDEQIANMKAETALKDYELKHIKPVELEIQKAELGLREKQILLAEKEIRLKEIQIPIMEKELEIKAQQLGIAEKELAIKEQQLKLAEFEIAVKAPAEVRSINAQSDLYSQKVITEKAQTDPAVIVEGSVIDHNNKVLKQQAISYDNDGKLKATSMLVDTWKVRRNDDPDEAPVNDINKLNDPNIGTAVLKVLSSVGITN